MSSSKNHQAWKCENQHRALIYLVFLIFAVPFLPHFFHFYCFFYLFMPFYHYMYIHYNLLSLLPRIQHTVRSSLTFKACTYMMISICDACLVIINYIYESVVANYCCGSEVVGTALQKLRKQGIGKCTMLILTLPCLMVFT